MNSHRSPRKPTSRRAFLTAAVGGTVAVVGGLAVRNANAGTYAIGVDYSFARPRPSALRPAGYSFACRYLSPNPAKNLTRAEAQALIAARVDIVCNWESNKDDVRGGYAQGVSYAQQALSQAQACGMPKGRPIYFSVDFDAQPADQTVINAYFDGIASVLGLAQTGAYGSYNLIGRLLAARKITWAWQTYAWSGTPTQWDARAQLRQVQNNIIVDGAACDRDEAWAADFGQWGQRRRFSAPIPGQPTLVPPHS